VLEDLQSIATIAATCVGIYVAVSGLNAWKRETIGRRDLDLCQKVIELFYEAERRVRQLRSPFSQPASESKDRPRQSAEGQQETEFRDSAWVPIARLGSQGPFWDEFFSYKFRMRALFGNGSTEAFEQVDEVLRHFRAAAITRYQCVRGSSYDVDRETLRGFDRTIWEVARDDDLGSKMSDAVAKMEVICIPKVRAPEPFRLF
jgi:hypothetical protein